MLSLPSDKGRKRSNASIDGNMAATKKPAHNSIEDDGGNDADNDCEEDELFVQEEVKEGKNKRKAESNFSAVVQENAYAILRSYNCDHKIKTKEVLLGREESSKSQEESKTKTI